MLRIKNKPLFYEQDFKKNSVRHFLLLYNGKTIQIFKAIHFPIKYVNLHLSHDVDKKIHFLTINIYFLRFFVLLNIFNNFLDSFSTINIKLKYSYLLPDSAKNIYIMN